MAGSGFRIEGLNDVLNRMGRVRPLVREAGLRALEECGIDLLGKAARRAPVKEGFLRGSGYAKFDTGTIAETGRGGGVSVVGSAGDNAKPTVTVGFSVPYAAAQHERLDYKHPLGGEAKYLENPMKEDQDLYRKSVMEQITEALERDGGGTV